MIKFNTKDILVSEIPFILPPLVEDAWVDKEPYNCMDDLVKEGKGDFESTLGDRMLFCLGR